MKTSQDNIYICVKAYTSVGSEGCSDDAPRFYKENAIHPGQIFSKGEHIEDIDSFYTEEPLEKPRLNYLVLSGDITALTGPSIHRGNHSYGTGERLRFMNAYVISANCLEEKGNRILDYFKIIRKSQFQLEDCVIPALMIECIR